MKNYLPWAILTLIVFLSFGLMVSSSLKESATMDELAHIPAGYGYVKYFDYRLNPEHPPLVKAIAAFPLLFQNLNFPTDKKAWSTDINGQWEAGAQFLYESGNNADKIIQSSRVGPMLLTIILIIFIYIWAKELMGGWWGLAPAFLFGISPTVLSHGHYVTTDIGAALGIFMATYYFVKFLIAPTKKSLLLSGLTFGIAQLMKFSAVLLIPFFIFLLIVFYLWKISYKRESIFSMALKHIGSLVLIFIIGYAIVYLVYLPFVINYPMERQASDTRITLASFANGPDPELKTCKLNSDRKIRCLAEINILMSENKILRPFAQYMLGVLMVTQRASGGNTGYFLGEVSNAGQWYYFPIVFLLKESLPSLLLIFIAFLLSVWGIIKKLQTINYGLQTFKDYLSVNFAEFSMISFVVFYWLYSIKSPLNIGIRHILPTMPFIYILSVGAIKKFGTRKIFKIGVAAVLITWHMTESLLAYPHFISYFNQIAGGTENGYKYVTDSNYDWGQDLKRLKDFTEKNNVSKIAVDYFGGGSPKYYLGDASAPFSAGKAEYWQSSKGNPKDYGIKWLAVSINTLQGALGSLRDGQLRKSEDGYEWLKTVRDPYKPDAKAGTSIFIYKLF